MTNNNLKTKSKWNYFRCVDTRDDFMRKSRVTICTEPSEACKKINRSLIVA